MILNMGPILRGEMTRMDISYDLSPDPVADVVFPQDAHVEGYLVDDAGYMHLHLTATLPYRGQCARCLDPVEGTLSLDFDRTVAAEGTISEEKLAMVDKAEQLLLDLGFRQVRVRIHGTIARIEVDPAEIPRIVEPENASRICSYLTDLGFSYVTLDLKGYRTGSMNETLKKK